MEVSERRYRYTGKERDEETGFSYHQWPYYAPWLARWTSADPEPRPEQGELFDYADDDPAGAIDLDGAQPKAPTSIKTPGKGPTRSKPQSSSGLKLDMFTAKVGEFEAKDLNEAATTVFGEISTNINKDTSREAKAVASTIFNRLRRIQEADAEKERTLADLKSATAARKAEEVKLERLKNNRRAEIKEFGSKEYKQRYAAQEAAVQKAMKTLGKAQIAANAASSTASQYRSSLRGGEKKKKPTLRDVVSPHSEYAGHKKGRDDVNAFGRMSKGDQKRNLERWRIAREAVRTLAANPDVADKYTGFKSKAYAKKHGIKGTLIGGNVFDGNWKRKR